MRKVFLWAMLAVFVCSAGVAFGADEPVPSTPPDTPAELTISSDALLGFGLYKVYSTDQPVLLRADGEPYFGNVKKFTATDVVLAAKVKAAYANSSYTMPRGTLTDTSTGLRYRLDPNNWRGNFCEYRVNADLSTLAGHKVMWNLYSSPDLVVGAAVIPESLTLSQNIANDEIVPYVKINHNSSGSYIGRIDLYFVKSGDWSTPVALGDSTVKVYVNGSSLNYDSPRAEFTNFNKPIRSSFFLGWDESELQSLTVEYDKDGAKYIWNFTPMFGSYSSIDFGELALENQPIKITAGSSLDVTLKLPERADLTDYFNGEDSYYMKGYFLQPGNRSVLEVDDSSVNFTQGSAGWNGLTWNEEKSTLSFRLLGVSPGRTVLRMNLPDLDTYYREIHVVSSDGDMHLETSTDTRGISLNVNSYASRARFMNGKPYYPSAVFSSMNMALAVSGDVYGDSYLGLVKGTTTDIHRIYNWGSGENHEISSYEGVRYDTADTSLNSEYPGSFSIESEDLDGYSVWIDLQHDDSFKVVSASLSALISGDYMTTAEQLTNFVPYFEMKHASDDVNNIVSLDWSFINPATGEKVTPEVSNIIINNEDVEGTSGTIDFADGGSVKFSYTYKGVNYTWDFYEMDYYIYSYVPPYYMTSGESRDVSVSIFNSADIEAIDLVIWDEDVVSADPVRFAPADKISFTLNALKAGTTRIGLVFAREGYTSYDKYTRSYNTVSVAESSTPADYEPTSGDIEAVITVGTFFAPVIEGSTHYTNNGFIESVNVELLRDGYIREDDYYNHIRGHAGGTIHFYSGDVELSSQDMYPSVKSYMDVDGVLFVQLRYGQYYPENNVTRIVWTASSDIITSGSADVPAGQLYSYRPCFKLKREGLNVSTLDYYFADSQDNNAGITETISDISVTVYTNWGSDIQNDDNSGTITLNLPEAFISVIYIEFKDDGKRYYGYFSPVDKPYNTTSADVLGWDIDDPDLPLVMTVGETLDVTLTAKNIAAPSVLIGNSAIVSMDFISSTDYTVKVRLTAKSAGMTSITLYDDYSMTLPREIWVADESGQVPHLTGDIDALVETLKSGGTTSGGWFSDDDTTTDTTTDYETAGAAEVLEGLSVYPRFVVPTDPSGDAYEQAWQGIYDYNQFYSAYMFTDDVEVLASRDAFAVFNEVSADLIARHPAQLPAVILPKIEVKANGMYTFRVPVDNITLKGTRIFMHRYPLDLDSGETPDGDSSIWIPAGVSIDCSGDIHGLDDDYSVSVRVTSPDVWRITSRDIDLPEGLAFSVEEINTSGDITSIRIFTSGDYYKIDDEEASISAYNIEKDYYSLIEWHIEYESKGMRYYDDEGTELEYISGDKYINVSMYMGYGTYAPIITAKATSNDVRLIRAALGYTPTPPNPPTPPAALTLTPSSFNVSLTLPATATITLTTANAQGSVTYLSSAAWATISGDTVTLAPTSAGTFSVTFTATDSAGHTATATISVSAAAPIPPASDDHRPDSGDVTPPASGDVTPLPAPGTDSEDVTPTPQPGPAPVSPDVRPVNPPADEPGQDSGNDSSDSGGDSSGDNTGGNSGGDNSGGNTGGDSGGDNSSNVDTVSGTPTESTLDVSDNSVVEKIISVLQSISQAISRLITGDTEVAALPESAMGVERTADDLSESDLAAIPAGQEPAVVLPIMRVQKAAVYVFGVDLTNLRVGALIFLHMMPDNGASSSAVAAADAGDEAYTFLDDNGNETDIVPPSRHVNVAAYMEPGKSYAPVITTSTANTNNGGNSGGNTNTDNGNTNTDNGTDTETAEPSSGSSGGCDSGFGVIAFAALALTLRRRSSR